MVISGVKPPIPAAGGDRRGASQRKAPQLTEGMIPLGGKSAIKPAIKRGLKRLFPRLYRRAKALKDAYDKESIALTEAYLHHFFPHLDPSAKAYRSLRHDALKSVCKYGIKPIEFFLFHFERLNDTGRRMFIGDSEKREVLNERRRHCEGQCYFPDKLETYRTFSKYYKREVVGITEDNKEAFLGFAARHPQFIMKDRWSARGKNVMRIDASSMENGAVSFFQARIAEGGDYIAEEVITQSEVLGRIHPPSVNTVRFVTYLSEDTVIHLFSFLRMGQHGSVIDNASNGGLAAAIDMETGIVTTPACAGDGTKYLKHPDTGVQIIGMQLPQWDDLLALVDELAHVVPQQRYVGWDLALTDAGWVMVEGNDCAMMTTIQMLEQQGLRERIAAAFGENWQRK